MRILREIATSDTKGPAWEYSFTMLASVVFWLNVKTDDGVKPLMPLVLRPDFTKNAKLAESFLKKYKIPVRDFRAYTDWIVDSEPDDEDHVATLLLDHLNAVRLAMPLMRRDLTLDDKWLELINWLRLWHKTENEGTLAKIKANITKFDMPTILTGQFNSEAKDHKPLLTEIRKLVKKLTGKEGDRIPLEDSPTIREKNPVGWKAYLALRGQVNAIYKQALRDHVRTKGTLTDASQAKRYLDAKGIGHKIPNGFVGKIDEEGHLYTRDGSHIPDSSNIDHGSVVKMNPDYTAAKDKVAGKNNNYVFTVTLPTKDAEGKNNVQYKYTAEKLKLNKAAKFDIVSQLLAKEKSIVGRWRTDLKSRDMGTKIMAAQCELSYDTCARIGGKDSKNMKGDTFGLTTLTVGNVKKRGKDRILDYVGKDSVHQRHVLKAGTPEMNLVIAIIDKLCADKTRADNLFTYDGVTYDAPKLRRYFSSVAAIPGVTPHKLRHMRGTRLATGTLQKQLDILSSKRVVTQALADASFKLALTQVGEMLGHVKGVGQEQKATWTTAAKNYVDVSVMADYYAQLSKYGVRIPKTLQTLLKV